MPAFTANEVRIILVPVQRLAAPTTNLAIGTAVRAKKPRTVAVVRGWERTHGGPRDRQALTAALPLQQKLVAADADIDTAQWLTKGRRPTACEGAAGVQQLLMAEVPDIERRRGFAAGSF
jgi:hypothetical protein